MFEVKISGSPRLRRRAGLSVPAKIHIGDYSESMLIPLRVWDLDQYIGNWRRAAADVLEKRRVGVLVTGLYSLDPRGVVEGWALKPVEGGDAIRVRNMVFPEIRELEGMPHRLRSMAEHAYDFDFAADGPEPVSEWQTTRDALKVFYLSLAT